MAEMENTVVEAENAENTEKTEKTGKEKLRDGIKELLSWIFIFAAAFLTAYIVTRYIIIKAEVPTGSMENTIMTDDRIIGNRLAYTFSEPERGDIIMFYNPEDESEIYVKRVIGIPGDTVYISGGVVYINDEPYEEDYIKEITEGEWGPYKVPAESYFVMGDNRNGSWDSRRWATTNYVKAEKIIAKTLFRYSPSLKWLK